MPGAREALHHAHQRMARIRGGRLRPAPSNMVSISCPVGAASHGARVSVRAIGTRGHVGIARVPDQPGVVDVLAGDVEPEDGARDLPAGVEDALAAPRAAPPCRAARRKDR